MNLDGAIGFNTFFWVAGNLVAASVFVSSLLFSVLYPILFNPSLTSAGKLIWRAILSIAGFGLLVVTGLFIDGQVEWWQMPADIAWWRPVTRLAVYLLIAYTFASLVWLLIARRFWPHTLRTAPPLPDEDTLNVKPRDLRRR